jgi:hypothetical protein
MKEIFINQRKISDEFNIQLQELVTVFKKISSHVQVKLPIVFVQV